MFCVYLFSDITRNDHKMFTVLHCAGAGLKFNIKRCAIFFIGPGFKGFMLTLMLCGRNNFINNIVYWRLKVLWIEKQLMKRNPFDFIRVVTKYIFDRLICQLNSTVVVKTNNGTGRAVQN